MMTLKQHSGICLSNSASLSCMIHRFLFLPEVQMHKVKSASKNFEVTFSFIQVVK
jgi:hypothetical protein